MATIVKAPSGTWKAIIHKTGWRTKRNAEDWTRRTKDKMVDVYIQRAVSERITVETALKRATSPKFFQPNGTSSAAGDVRHSPP